MSRMGARSRDRALVIGWRLGDRGSLMIVSRFTAAAAVAVAEPDADDGDRAAVGRLCQQ